MKPTEGQPQPQPDKPKQPALNLINPQVEQVYKQAESPSKYQPAMVSQTQAFQYAIKPEETTEALPPSQPPAEGVAGIPNAKSVAELKKDLLAQVSGINNEPGRWHRWRPLATALLAGLLYLGLTYNGVAVAQVKQYVSPGSRLTTPVIVDPSQESAVTNESRLIIPKINVDVPVIYDVLSFDEGLIQNALERGVVHYGTTALPGQAGNNVIVGHSSNNFFNQGQYKFVFVLLDRLENGDTFILHYQGQRYIYRVFNKAVIEPDDFRLIEATATPVTTLVTCTPPGTSWRRLVVQAEQISPALDPSSARAAPAALPSDISTPIPSYAPSIWQRIGNLFN